MTQNEIINIKYEDNLMGKNWTGRDYAKYYYDQGEWYDFMEEYGYSLDDNNEIVFEDDDNYNHTDKNELDDCNNRDDYRC